jgi:hypothetical protein
MKDNPDGWNDCRAHRDLPCTRCERGIPKGVRCRYYWEYPDEKNELTRRVARYVCALCTMEDTAATTS